MYTKYYGFNEKPFTLTPNPRFIYLSKNHKEAFAHLLYGINNHYGFIELIGEVGTGKTTVLRTLLGQLHEEDYRAALIVNPCLTGVELLRTINHEFGLNSESEYANDLLADLNKFLLNETAEGRTVVLVIDEAQNLQPDVLEQIRLISNLETENDKLIQIILAGQPELETLLERPDLRQLNQRIAVRYRLRPMSMDETSAYIRHRMAVAGENGGVSFSRYAIKWIYLSTRGVPRMVNILCDRALLIGYTDERRRITSWLISRAIREILNVRQVRRLYLALAGVISLCMISGALVINFRHGMPAKPDGSRESSFFSFRRPATVPVESLPVAAPPESSKQQLSELQQKISLYDQQNTHIHAFNAIAESWGAQPIKKMNGKLIVPDAFKRLAEKRGLRVTVFKGTLDEVLRFDLPFIVATKVSGSMKNYCFAVTSAGKDSVTLSPALSGNGVLAKNALATISNGTFYLIWRNQGLIPNKLRQNEKRPEVRTLQQLLVRANAYHGAVNGSYDASTATAVRDFQRTSALPPDDSLGELTLAALARFGTGAKIPSLSLTGGNR